MKFLLPFDTPKLTNARLGRTKFQKSKNVNCTEPNLFQNAQESKVTWQHSDNSDRSLLCNGVQHENDGIHTICGLALTECLSIYESILNLEPPYELYTQALPNVFCIELTTASTNDKAAHRQTEPSVFSLVKSY